MATSLSKIDPYLPNAFAEASDRGEDALDVESVGANGVVMLPVLIRLSDNVDWAPPLGFAELARVGNVLSGRCTIDGIQALERDASVLSVESSRGSGVEECNVSVPFIGADVVQAPPLGEQGDKALIAVIDSGIDVTHRAFLDKSGTTCRIAEIWDQRDTTGPAPNLIYPALKLNYGTVHQKAAIQGFATGALALPPWLAPPPGGGQDTRIHGTHVTSIAAGQAAGAFAGGVAPEAELVIVIPRNSAGASVGYSSSHVEALAYIKEVASTMKLPVVVNASLGKNAGAHDGLSPLEVAFDEFTGGGREPGRVIVKSAGNERGNDGHAKLTLSPMSQEDLIWQSAATPRREDVLELWFKACDEFQFRIHDSAGSPPTIWVDWNTPQASGNFTNSSNSFAMTYTRYHVDNGDSQLLIVIRRGAAPMIQAGTWRLEVASKNVLSPGVVHAWVERDVSRAVRFSNHQNEEMSLNIPGTAQTVITVGAVNSTFPTRNTNSSSYGPTRDLREKPEVVAPGDGILAAEAGKPLGAIAKSGTSMAAPHVTGAVALLLSHLAKKPGSPPLPNAVQIRAALTQLTKYYTGHFTVNRGYGLLDAEALFKAFD